MGTLCFITNDLVAIDPVVWANLDTWARDAGTPIFGGTAGNFAGDPHVWWDGTTYRMLYTTDSGADGQAIGMATSSNLTSWMPVTSVEHSSELVLTGAGPASGQDNQETAFYYKTPAGAHHIYYIGYDGAAEGTYASQIYRAISASNILGPYVRESSPVLALGAGGTYDDGAMTSPTIVEYGGSLYLNYLAWDDSPNSGTANVINAGATAGLDGATWSKSGTISWDDIFGAESHTEKGPDGLYYRVGVVESGGNDAITIGYSTHPFGPYNNIHSDILTLGGAGVGEVVSITSPTLYFNTTTKKVYMFYGAVDTGGFPWMTGLATADYQ